MPQRIDDKELEQILNLVRKHPTGISRSDLQTAYKDAYEKNIEPRTLQRRLTRLIAQGHIHPEGAGRATHYFATQTSTEPEKEQEEGYVPVSAEGAEIRDWIRQPQVKRIPVGYHAEFMLDYVPGQTWYLEPAHRERLREIGATPLGEYPAGTHARQIFNRLLIDLSWASSQLEGNTYSRLDTKNLIEFGIQAEGKDATEAQMILNHKNAIELLVERAEEVGFNMYTFLNLHAALSDSLLENPADEGVLRTRWVQIAGTVFHPLGVPQQVEEFFRLFLEKAGAIPDPFEQAFFVMVHIPYLQPFIDGNKRVSRLGANLPLIKYNLCPLSFIDVPHRAYIEGLLGVYELNRVELLRDVFLWAYERSALQYVAVRDSVIKPDPFRLRYRSDMVEVIVTILDEGWPPQESTIRRITGDRVPASDLDRFVEMTFAELLNLHEGNIARYRIRPSEFRAWRERWKPA